MSKKLGYVSLGCAKNLVDTEIMLGALKDNGYEITETLDEAEIIIVNTCTFIEKAKQESINTILEMSEYKQFGACRGLIVAGCLSQQYQEELFAEIPEIDALIGTGSWNRIMEAIEAIDDGKRICIMDSITNIYNERMPRMQTTPTYSVKVEGIEWYRLLYLYPKYFTDELLDLIVAEPKICNYIDLPLQHINDDILRRMNRKDRKADIVNLLQKVRSKASHVTLRTSLIVGFPGETDEQFEELCEFVKDVRFDNMGVFTYSQEDGTPAGAMNDQVPEEVKEERYHALMAIQAAISEENNRDLEGTEHEAIIEEISEDEHGHLLAKGRLETQAPDVDGNMYIEDVAGLEVGQIVPVTVAQGFAYDVVAEVRTK